MMFRSLLRTLLASATGLSVVALLFTGSLNAQGVSLRGVGPVNESMAGAGTALPLSATGAIHWNPGSLAEFDTHQAEMGLGLILPDTRVASTVGPFSGSSDGESGVAPLPSMALVLKGQNPRVTYGIGVYAIAGFKLNYDASLTNPVLMPQGALGPVPTFGRVNTEAEFFQIAPTIAYTLNDCWSIGIAPTITIGRLAIEPLLATAPSAAGYPTGSGTRYHFGGGGQAGLYYRPNQRFSAGLSVKTEQYFEDFRFKSQENATGAPIRSAADFEYPLIVSLGTGYRLSDRTAVACDVRYFDYGQADGFGTAGLFPDGSLAGLSWKSSVAVATGLSHRVNQMVTMRCGYVWNESPITSENAFFNTAAPLNLQHVAAIGVALHVHPNMTISSTYQHAFDQATSGLYAGIPGTDVTLRTAAYAVSSGVTINF